MVVNDSVFVTTLWEAIDLMRRTEGHETAEHLRSRKILA
jgi:hypothetical protein